MGHLNKKDILFKEYLSLERELQELRNREWELGYTELENPIRHGWFLEIRFSEKLKDIPKYKELFEFLTSKNRKNDYWGRNKKDALEKFTEASNHYNVPNASLILNQKSFNRLTWSSQKLCVPFEMKVWNEYRKRYFKYIVFKAKIPPKYVTLKYVKSYITKRKNIDPNITSRKEEINNMLESAKFFKLKNKGYGGYWRDWEDYDYRKRRAILKQDLGDLLINVNP